MIQLRPSSPSGVAAPATTSTSSAARRRLRVDPRLRDELRKIAQTPTGSMLLRRAKARGLHTIRVGNLPGAIVGLYSSRGVITIENPGSPRTFQRLVHELCHAAGFHPHKRDQYLVPKTCREAGVRYFPPG